MVSHALLRALAFAGSLSTVNADSFVSKGCYAYSDLESLLTSKGQYTYQTNSYCEDQCSGFSVAATLSGSTCYCGDSLPSNLVPVDNSNCNSPCQGFGSQTCGGNGYLSVFTNGQEDTDATSGSSSGIAASSSTTSLGASSTKSSSSSTNASTKTSSTQQSRTSSIKSTSTESTSTESTSTSSSSTKSTGTSDSTQSITTSNSASTTQGPTTQIITSVISASDTVVTVTTSSEPTSSASSSSSSSSGSSGSSSLSKGAIAGIAVGAVAGVAVLIALIVFLIIRARSSSDDDEEDHPEPEKNRPPIHNDFNSFYGFEEPPVPAVYMENGHKRLSNGSLPDARHEKTLRVVNPDETLNDTTLRHEADIENDDWKYSR